MMFAWSFMVACVTVHCTVPSGEVGRARSAIAAPVAVVKPLAMWLLLCMSRGGRGRGVKPVKLLNANRNMSQGSSPKVQSQQK
jgi:hypothetical protein